jgi:pimeloyl-ACP methyl ester carboxylesterase
MLGVSRAPRIRELTVQSADLSLAGSFWAPAEPRDVTVLMHPGSGPSDRHNDVFFPPIRRHLLECGFSVSSVDKRGAGGSDGLLTGVRRLPRTARLPAPDSPRGHGRCERPGRTGHKRVNC